MPNGLKLTTLLCLAFAAAAQQQHPQQHHQENGGYRSSPQENAALRPNTLKQAGDLPVRVDTSTYNKRNGKYTSSTSNNNKRAVATLAPADFAKSAVHVPSAIRSAAGTSGGLTTPPRARSLQDWEVENFVLLATVDGSIYARDRNSGRELWKFHSERPMVETIYHRHNNTQGGTGKRNQDDYMWIVEPNEDGSLYVLVPGPDAAIQKLGMTVKQLAEVLSPYAHEDSPFVFTAEKRNTLFTLNATNGAPIKYFSASGSGVMDQKSCRRINNIEVEEEEDECEPTPTLHLGRTEYVVSIQDGITQEDICTIRYFEWTPNNRDRDLAAKYLTTMDNKYIYSRFDGSIIALEHLEGIKEPHALYQKKATSPVVRVFDVVRPQGADARDAPLVILPQPIAPPTKDDSRMDSVFVNQTESGSWYAMSETSYPSVTDGAAKAECCQSRRGGLIEDASFWDDENQHFKPSALIGVHQLPDEWQDQQPADIPTIDPPEERDNLAEQNDSHLIPTNRTHKPISAPLQSSIYTSLQGSFDTFFKLLVVGAIGFIWFQLQHKQTSLLQPESQNIEPKQLAAPLESASVPQQTSVKIPDLEGAAPEQTVATERRVHFAPDEPAVVPENVTVNGEIMAPTDGTQIDSQEFPPTPEKPKKKAHRGSRGGAKNNKKKLQKKKDDQVDDEVSRIMDGVMGPKQEMQPDRETFVEGGIEDVSDITHINDQLKHTDRCLGNGSGGTTVYEGTFEGRDVAVKRMLLQYFDLASQEIKLLSQSDDHPNVIRYYCHHKGKDFLYIAVERCQASLWDLYHDGYLSIDTLKDEQKQIVNSININVAPALQQLALGLGHLHGLRIIHRDIKPQNILVTFPKKNQKGGPRLVISDFGLCRTLPDNASTLVGTMGNAGTIGWKAPELIGQPRINGEGRMSSTANDSTSSNEAVAQGVKRAVDIFSLGCVFFYVLTNGFHPFDSESSEIGILEREINIKKGISNFDKLKLLGEEAQEPMQLVEWMLAPNPEDRPTAVQVANHPFFWPPAKRLNFLCDVSDHWERESRDPPSPHLIVLEDIGHDKHIHGQDFLKRLDKKFIDTLGKQRKYTGDRMLDLLRALRNKKNHYADMPEEVQKRVGPLPEGYLGYWTLRFPLLLTACYDAVRRCGLEGEPRFRPYLDAEGGGGS
ncbi:kinase-like protein [Tothia fuscella]|uniref:non-specific serine/threonine protein kinase n=1 Tax=Tothia fuscella TaxID=1048955 RepID=A0A9P4TT41_9PEZI|nr:kinase-like protein [Tothia fuscella]